MVKSRKNYLQPVYGTDYLELKRTRNLVAEEVRLPVYGIKNGDSAFIATIEQGDAIAYVEASVSQKTNSYNNVFASFVLRTEDELQMSGLAANESNMVILDADHYTGDISVNYTFLEGDNANYSGMALAYKNKLIAEGGLKPSSASGQSNFYLDLIGAVEKNKFIVGFKYKGLQVMTDYKQASDIVAGFNASGIENIQLRYLGWFNEGMNHETIKKVDPIRQLGSDKDLLALEEKVNETGGELFLDVATQLVGYYSDSYSRYKEASRYLDGFDGFYLDYNRATLRMNTYAKSGVYSLVSPNVLPYHIESFVDSYDSKVDIGNISLRDMGDILNSDKKKKYPIDRTEAQAIVEEQLDILDQNFNHMMVVGGNAYAVSQAEHLIDVPGGDSGFFILDDEVPFYQMVFDGIIPYTGQAVNVSSSYNFDETLLKYIEYGMSPHFLLTAEDTFNFRDTSYESLYSTQVDIWSEDALALYEAVRQVNEAIGDGCMFRHKIHARGVHEMLYDNGISVLVNYTDEVVSLGGLTIEANSYLVEGAKE